ncbi:hypothetical protein [Longitalea arenae]|uniref:hypothetical protein n=1 Tax=Longitalea arenae TaxID=2812558 RepID=UPI001967D2A9|nr:hypothetical protein [Longitalea arenae]
MTDFDVLMHQHNVLRAEFLNLRIEFNEKLLRFRAFVDEASDFMRNASTLPASFDITVITPLIKSDPIFIKEHKISVTQLLLSNSE